MAAPFTARAPADATVIDSTDLAQRRKGDPEKLKIAAKLRAETTMTLSWIAARLQMGAASSLGNLFSARRAAQRGMISLR
jgi:hypothetical protein